MHKEDMIAWHTRLGDCFSAITRPNVTQQEINTLVTKTRLLMWDFLDLTAPYSEEHYAQRINLSEAAREVLFKQVVYRYHLHIEKYTFTIDRRQRKIYVRNSELDEKSTCIGCLVLEGKKQRWTTFGATVDDYELGSVTRAFKSLDTAVTFNPDRPLVVDPFRELL